MRARSTLDWSQSNNIFVIFVFLMDTGRDDQPRLGYEGRDWSTEREHEPDLTQRECQSQTEWWRSETECITGCNTIKETATWEM